MFIGQYFSKLTEKGRSALPFRFRRELGSKAIVAKWYEGCLVVVPEKNWKGLLDKLTGKSEIITGSVRDTDRFILGSAFEIKFDGQGRFLIPKALRDYAVLKKEIVFIGLGERIEMWDKDLWSKREKYIQEKAGDLVEELAIKGD